MKRLIVLSFACLAMAALPSAARADYRLSSGDILDVDVFGVSGFKRRVTVNVDGDVSLPFLGEIKATGLSLGDLRRALARRLEQTGMLKNPDVTIELAEYRPFYISGDVARPGAIAYRPGLTVRHAIALAGGYDALRFRAENPLLAAPEIRSQYDGFWIELVRRHARALSLQAQIDGKTLVDLSVLKEAPVAQRLIDDIITLERRDLALRLTAINDRKRFLSQSLAQADTDILTLREAERQQQGAIADQSAASDRASTAQSRGMVALVRVEEERRALAALRGRQVDNTTRLVQARQQRDDYAHQLDLVGKEDQLKLVRELQETLVDVERLRAQVRSAGERLIYVGALKEQLRSGTDGPQLTLFRRDGDNQTRVPATENSDIQPDDVLDVAIRPDQIIVGPQR